MATQTINYGTETNFGTLSNLHSLANNAAKPLGAVDNSSTKALNYRIWLQFTLNSSGVSATGTVEIYLIESTDGGTDYTDGISPTTTSDIASSLKNAKLMAVLNANANSQVVRYAFDVLGDWRGCMRDCPKHFSIVVVNKSGATLASSGGEATYTAIKYDFA